MSDVRKVVLAYSGGLDTSVAVRWIRQTYGCEVVCYCADVGQDEDLEAARAKALAVGAHSAVVEDLRLAFVRDYVFPALRSAAIYEGQYLLGTALARPCIARGLIETVRAVGADAVAHGGTGKGNDQVRFELAFAHFAPGLRVIAPWREWEFRGRGDLIAYAREHGIPVESRSGRDYSIDRNLLHVSYEGGELEDPWSEPGPGTFGLARDPREAPDTPRTIEIGLERGVPTTVDGETLGPVELLSRLNQIAGEHGVGRVDMVENRFVGMKSRGVYETPGGTVLHLARQAVESIVLDREERRLRDELAPRYAAMVYGGLWFSPERASVQALMDRVAERVTGTARLILYKGSARVLGRKAPGSLYNPDVATFESGGDYDHRDAAGFIALHSLRLRQRAETAGK